MTYYKDFRYLKSQQSLEIDKLWQWRKLEAFWFSEQINEKLSKLPELLDIYHADDSKNAVSD